MENLESLYEMVEKARQAFIASCSALSPLQYEFKPSDADWSVNEIVEHMVWAERAGVSRIWRALAEFEEDGQLWQKENPNQGHSLLQVIKNTWAEKEKVPDIAKPRWGGPLAYWIASLSGCSATLNLLVKELHGKPIDHMVYPHPISGPLTVRQRIEFLAFHLDRHKGQVERLKRHPDFPS